MHDTAVAVLVVAVLATVSCAAPLPQAELAPVGVDDTSGLDGNTGDLFDPMGQEIPANLSDDIAAAQDAPVEGAIDEEVALDTFLDGPWPDTAAPLDTPADGVGPDGIAQLDDGSSAGNPVSNLVGNSLTQIDDSVNVSNTDIDYPGNSELTGNTGTAVSGNNNEIMPIINAPVTVIINPDHHDSLHKHPVPQSPLSDRMPPPSLSASPQQQQPVPATQPALSQVPGSAENGQPLARQWPEPPLLNNPADGAVDPFAARIQQLILYAIAMSQSHV
ncbi:hypothetical protein COEREDRAFT_81231 [Coemansia reversa NRRL 1564]|uniref:Uncharacterized protein n=1 Tax=Coemansia reversa (strain ATCC 12441 / NRRL 1564) TaxID=763665 RepID=A0A2G5BC48_COERN|nr:hypothetical protein COEREDRAFT_81231 [Coemansia reversa NRRL 1564]|eukprot:PIA16583.1 hypothetical protein COEREDRAFT_81231 [Coemansia reversa NRRL 1564]